jgi:glycosyltransferase involved in cell wall biosynthesis
MTPAAHAPSLAIVIPARNAESLLPQCLNALRAQLDEGDALVVVDDASSDGTADLAASLGAEVIRRPAAGGPYAARNEGWRATNQPYVLFTDTRCVAREGLLTRVRQAAATQPDLVFADVLVQSGKRLAERVAAGRQHLLVGYYDSDSFLPFFPTACLTVSRKALEDVRGFRVVESGGDADLCWRIQLSGHREIREIREPLMEWRPRSSVRDLLEQWAKYGRSGARLRTAYRSQGAVPSTPPPAWRLAWFYLLQSAGRIRRGQRPDVVAVDGLIDVVYNLSYGRTLRRVSRNPRLLSLENSE